MSSEQEPVRNVGGKPRRVMKKLNTIPTDIMENQALNTAIKSLPENYNFEIHKSIWKILSDKVDTVALQFPEGLLMYACLISDIFISFTGVRVIILGDVTYGACCIDDFTASKLGAQLLIHYGHSCLVPVNVTRIKAMYVFVEIQFDPSHLVATIKNNFKENDKIALMGTIQFTNVVHLVKQQLSEIFTNLNIPQAKPLSPGETLGCTSPVLKDCEILIFVADGRFHLEAAMIQNPLVNAYRYDPYARMLTREKYDDEKMKKIRWNAIQKAKEGKIYGIILGTLGRQGNLALFKRIQKILNDKGKKSIPFLMAEINLQKLALIDAVDVWVQVACPRLSIDWGNAFHKPILTSYELNVAMEEVEWKEVYPMDYYNNAGGSWSNYYIKK